MKFSVLAIALAVLASCVASASTRDTLAFFDPYTASAFYRDHSISAQAARFDLPAPAYVRRLTIWLAGKSTGTATLTLYGDEGAFAAPLLGQPLGSAITLRKNRPGVQKVEVVLPADLFVERPQFFVVISDLSEGIVWLSDRREKRARCESGSDRWLYQGIRGGDGVWRAGKYGYAVEAIVDYPQDVPPTYLSDITEDAGFPSFDEVPAANDNLGSIAWADVDADARLDVLVNGSLYINKGDDRFEDAGDRLGEVVGTSVHHFIDIENDGDPDILLLGLPDGGSALLLNDGDGYFRRLALELPAMTDPTTVSISDVDGDGYLDAFVGQGRNDSGVAQPSYLLVNNRSKGFVASIPFQGDYLGEGDSVEAGVLSSQWIDYDSDGDPDLFLTTQSSEPASTNHLFLNDGTGRFSPHGFDGAGPSATESFRLLEQSVGGGLSSDWGDYDSDGDPDLLQPVSLTPAALSSQSASATPVRQQENGSLRSSSSRIAYQGFSGGGVWGDADNDGHLDALMTSACACRFASLYVQQGSGEFRDESFAYGLFRLPAGSDGVWVDYNNDGKLDLSTFVGGRFTLLKNTGDFQTHWLEADLSGSGVSSSAVGGRVTVHYGGGERQVRPIVSGRGLLMQGPLRVHFGLGDASAVDSLVVEWGDGERRTVVAPALNRIHSPFREEQSADAQTTSLAFTAWPNPFRTSLNFRYRVAEKTHVRLEIHGVEGGLLSVVVDEEQEAGEQSVEWRARGGDGTPLSAGTYIYRIRVGSQVLTGRAVLAK